MPANDLIFQRLEAATDAELSLIGKAVKAPIIGQRSADIAAVSRELRADATSVFKTPFQKDHELRYRKILEGVVGKAADAAGWKTPSIEPDAEETWLEDFIVHAFAFAANKKGATAAASRAAREAGERSVRGKPAAADHSNLAKDAALIVIAGFQAGLIAKAAIWLGGPAMRRVTPAVLGLIHIRARLEAEQNLGGTT